MILFSAATCEGSSIYTVSAESMSCWAGGECSYAEPLGFGVECKVSLVKQDRDMRKQSLGSSAWQAQIFAQAY